MCKHRKIIVTHYANEETNNRIGCKVRCAKCNEILFKNEKISLAYEYVEKHRDKFDMLIDFTCDNLNSKFDIKDEFGGYKGHKYSI